jgi:ribA/ribD-fused uncharacterized protein
MNDEEINFYSRKKNDYGFLSNFYPAKMKIDGKEYATNEHFYQSQKAIKPELQEWIRTAPTPYAAMIMGRHLRASKGEFDPDWEKPWITEWPHKKIAVMMEGLRCKFRQNPDLKEKLLATGDAVLHEDSPDDMCWGKKGQDWLGRLLMKVRDEMRRLENE